MAEKILGSSTRSRVGYGSDIHRLVARRPFILGGEKLKWSKGPLGHSDGDCLLHAVSDALLGAIGKGDIGDYFSDRNKRFKNISSVKIISTILDMVHQENWQVENLDCTVHLERPRLGPYKSKIRKRLCRLLNVPENSVNIKAKTREGLGSIGASEAVSCEAVVLIKKIG